MLEPEAAALAVGSDLAKVEAERERLATNAGAQVAPVPLSATGLTNDQALALDGLLTSTNGINVLVGAAGTGKSHVVARLAEIVRGTTGRRVIGVATSENAARVLKNEGLDDAHNIANFLGYAEGTDVRRGHLPIGEGDWLVVDEAGTTETTVIAELNEVVKKRGAHLLLTGDPYGQFSSVGAGGVMRLIADEHGYYELHEVKRFKEAWEGPASLRIRAGDATAIREYIDRGRVLEGTEEEVTGQLVKRYTGSLVAGRNPLLITDSNTGAAKLAAQVRDQLIGLGVVDGEGEVTGLADGNEASRGDLIRAMRNDKRIDTGGQKLANRDVLRIDRLGERDAVDPPADRHQRRPARVRQAFTLPRAYLEEESALVYGGNLFVSQGLTVDDSFQVYTDPVSAASVYVPLTRGRDQNIIGVVTEQVTADPLGDRAPPPRKVTAEALLTEAITRERDDLTVTEYLRKEQDTEYGMASLVGRWQTLTRDAQFTAYEQVMREAMTPADYAKMAADPAKGPLVRQLRAAELAGQDATRILREAINQRDFTSAGSVGAVLHGRVTRLTGPVSHKALSSYQAATPDLADPQAAAAARELARLADERATQLGEQAVAERPVWSLHALGEPPPDPVARQDWVDRASRIAAWRELASYKDPVQPVGPAPAAGATELRAAWRGAADAAGMSPEDQGIRETAEMQLVDQARQAERVKGFAPPDVAQELRDTELVKGDAVAEAQRAEAAARNAAGAEAAEARELASIHKQVADELLVRAAWLSEQDEHRREWHATNAEKIARGAQARAELERRQEAGELVGPWDIADAYLKADLEPEAQDKTDADNARWLEAQLAAMDAEAAGAQPQVAEPISDEKWLEEQLAMDREEAAAATGAEAKAEAPAEPGAQPAAEVETRPAEAGQVVPAEPEPEPGTPPEPEVIQPVGSDAEWFADRARREAETKAETEAEAKAEPEPKVEAAAPEPAPAEAGAQPVAGPELAEPEPVTPAEPEAEAQPEPVTEPDREKTEPEHKAGQVAEAEPKPATARAEPEAEADVQAPDDNEETAAARAGHYRAVAEHRERAVEHPGRAQVEAARADIEAAEAAQARINQDRAEAEAGDRPFNSQVDREAQAQAGRQAEAQREAATEAGD